MDECNLGFEMICYRLSVCCKHFTFSTSPEPLYGQSPNLAQMFL